MLNDFGTGYSSLSYLQRLPVAALKIDRSFVAALESSEDDSPIIRGVLGMASGLQLDVVAEGVETAAQAHALRRPGCPHAQGYPFGRPMPAHEARTLL